MNNKRKQFKFKKKQYYADAQLVLGTKTEVI